uniref:Uncharacterized protein n=1 Tax=viral metagenome TaxID=1070528 RepID=A0A6C0LDK6_9ZZZZ
MGMGDGGDLWGRPPYGGKPPPTRFYMKAIERLLRGY